MNKLKVENFHKAYQPNFFQILFYFEIKKAAKIMLSFKCENCYDIFKTFGQDIIKNR